MALTDARPDILTSVARPRATAAPSNPIAISAIGDRDGFERIGAAWRALESASPAPTFFQSFDWCRLVFELEEGRAKSQFLPLILVATEAGRMAGLLPLKRVRSVAATILTGLGEPFQQYTDLVLSPGADAGRVLEAMLGSPELAAGADAIELRKVRGGSALFRALGSRVEGIAPVDAAPFVVLGPHADFASYHKTVNAKSRKNMRNQRNRLARDAPVAGDSLTSAFAVGALIRSSFEGRVEWLEREGLASRAFRDPDFGRFIARFADQAVTGIEVLAVALKHGDTTIAEQWGFVHKRRYYAYVASWDPAYEGASPGKLIMEEVLRAAHARGVEIVDFLMPAARYKLTWAEASTPVYDIVLPLNARGRLTAKLWTGWLRPIAKRSVLALPAGVRSRLARVVRA